MTTQSASSARPSPLPTQTQTSSQTTQQSNGTSITSIPASSVLTQPSASTAMQTPPFLTKLYQLVHDPNTTSLVSWTNGDGLSFTVHKTDEFARDVLPKYFKHSNFSSFVRQLNQYGFHKQNPDKWMFGHDSFRKDRPDMLKNITRRRPKQAMVTPVTQAMVAPHDISQNRAVLELGHYGIDGELKALKRDKDILIKELVITRQAEEKLKDRCESLENRMQALEHNTKQMQSFIVHYFSQVLQPYSHAVVSRKRKRLPSSTQTDANAALHPNGAADASGTDAMDVVTADPIESNEMTKMAQMAQAAAAAAAAGTSTVDALRVMMQQMGVNVTRNPAAAAAAAAAAHHAHAQANPRAIEGAASAEDRPRIAFDPPTVQELPEVTPVDDMGVDGTVGSAGVVGPVGSNGGVGNGIGLAKGKLMNGGSANSGPVNGGLANGGLANGGLANGGLANGLANSGVANGRLANGRLANGGVSSSGLANGGLANGGLSNGMAMESSSNGGHGGDVGGNGASNVGSTSGDGGGAGGSSDISLDFFGDISVSPQSSLNLDAFEHELKESSGRANSGNDVETMSLDSRSFGVVSAGPPQQTNQGINGTMNDTTMSDTMKGGENDDVSHESDEERAIEQLLELDDSALPPPMTHLPEGTDITSLARRIESFAQQHEERV